MRDYSLLEDIYLGDIEKIEAEREQKDVTLSECIAAVKCYSQATDKLTFNIAKIVFDEYTAKHNLKEDINDLINLSKSISYNGETLIRKMVKNEHIKGFLSENKFNTVDFIDEKLRLNSLTPKDKDKINTLIEFESFKQVLKDNILLEELNEFIALAKESADIVINKNKNLNKDTYAPLAVFLAEDVVETLVYNRAEHKNINTNLWDKVERYDLTNIKNADLEEMSDFEGPQHLLAATKEPIYEANWVLLENGDLKFGSTYYGYGNHRPICHTDLANGESVVSGGMAYFSADKTKLLAIDNKSGHYQPSLDSVLKTLPAFKKSDIDIEITIISEFGWDNPKPFKDTQKINDDIIDRISKIRAKSFPQLSKDSNNESKPPKPSGN